MTNPIIQKKIDYMDAFMAGVEELLGMTMEEYAALCVDHPKQAKKAMKRAIKLAEEKQADA